MIADFPLGTITQALLAFDPSARETLESRRVHRSNTLVPARAA